MMKRVVLEHTSGLRQICGILDIASDADIAPQLSLRGDTFTKVKVGPRHITYRELCERPNRYHRLRRGNTLNPLTCANCLAKGSWWLEWGDQKLGHSAILCSLDCGIEYLWRLREAQPKLSKSKEPI